MMTEEEQKILDIRTAMQEGIEGQDASSGDQ